MQQLSAWMRGDLPLHTTSRFPNFHIYITFSILNPSIRQNSTARMKRVQKVLDMLGLSEISDSVVGNEESRGISGGQMKRLSIGVEVQIFTFNSPFLSTLMYLVCFIQKIFFSPHEFAYKSEMLGKKKNYLLHLLVCFHAGHKFARYDFSRRTHNGTR